MDYIENLKLLYQKRPITNQKSGKRKAYFGIVLQNRTSNQ